MNCKHEWNREFIDLLLSRNFRSKDYKKHRENVLLEREKSFFPDTIGLLEENREQYKECKEKLDDLRAQRAEVLKTLADLNASVTKYRNYSYHLESDPTSTIKDIQSLEKKTYIRPCIKTGCHGYINHKGTCGICKSHMCMQCHEEKMEGHECLQENIDSVLQIKKETRSCPKCHVCIFKIDGCRQMWCTHCRTAFDWKTGNVIAGRIHNPHYYEWQKNQMGEGRGGGEADPCQQDELPALTRIRQHYLNINLDIYTRRRFVEIHRRIVHIQEIEMPRLREGEDESIFRRNIISRVQFLKNSLNEERFKTILVQRDNQMVKKKALYQLYEMITHTVIQLFYESLTFSCPTFFPTLLQKIDSLLEYSNQQLSAYAKRFGVRPLVLGSCFEIQR